MAGWRSTRDPEAIYHRLTGNPGSPNFGSFAVGLCGEKMGPGHRSAVKISAVNCPVCLAKIAELRAGAKERAARMGISS